VNFVIEPLQISYLQTEMQKIVKIDRILYQILNVNGAAFVTRASDHN
jgi:hypothetical protein